MATKTIAWDAGGGNLRLTYNGVGNGNIVVESDDNLSLVSRSKVITLKTTDGSITKNVTINQAACPFIDIWPSDSTSTVNIWPLSQDWENGTISGGTEYYSATRCRSVLIDINGATAFELSVNSGWKVEIDYYNSGGVWMADTGWKEGDVSLVKLLGAAFIKMLFAKTDNSNVSPSDASSVCVVYMQKSDNWINGSISGQTYFLDMTRCITKEYIDISGGNSLSLVVNNGWNVEVDYFDANKSWLSDTGWSGTATFTLQSNAKYIRIIYRKTTNRYVSPSDSSLVGSLKLYNI